MLGNSRLYLMIQLADFRQEEKNKSLRIVKYYKRDYLALALVKNWLATTAAYLIFIGIFLLFRADFIISNLNRLHYGKLILFAVVVYFVLLAAFSIAAYVLARIRYKNAQVRVREYAENLKLLEHIYEEEAAQRSNPFGGVKR